MFSIFSNAVARALAAPLFVLFFASLSGAAYAQSVPGAPVLSSATPQLTATALVLVWTAPSDNGGAAITGYEMSWVNVTNPNFPTGNTKEVTGAGTLTGTIGGLHDGTTYKVRVAAINSAGRGAYSNELQAQPVRAPGVPQNVAAVRVDFAAEIDVSWEPPSFNGGAVTKYHVGWRAGTSGAFTQSAALEADVRTYNITGLTYGTAYQVRVAAENANGIGAYSDPTANVVTPATIPQAPQNVVITAGNGTVHFTWDPPTSDGGTPITQYIVHWFEDGIGIVNEIIVSPTPRSYTLTGLTNGTAYTVRVRSENEVGEGGRSPNVPVTPGVAPAAPTLDTAVAGNRQITATWTAPDDGGLTISGYTLSWKNMTRSDYPSGNTFAVTGATTLTGVIPNLSNGVTYDVRVAAENAQGFGPQSNVVQSKPVHTPSAPQNVSAAAGASGALDVSWGVPSATNGEPVTAYYVEYRAGTSGDFTRSSALAAAARAHTITGLTNGTEYQVQVAAENSVGVGAFSDPTQNQVTPAVVPSAPTLTAVTGGNGQFSVVWTVPADNGGAEITRYTMSWKNAARGDYPAGNVMHVAGASSVTGTITGVTNAIVYDVRVVAENSRGVGAHSNALQSTPFTTPDAPRSVVATRGNTEISFTWNFPGFNGGALVTAYRVEWRINSVGGDYTAAEPTGAGTARAHTITGLTNGTAYDVRVTAANPAGFGTPSAVEQITPATTPNVPQNVTATAGSAGQIDVAWDAPDNGGDAISGYKVRWKSAAEAAFAGADIADASGLSHTIASLENGAAYDVEVAAVNSVGDSAFSAAVQTTTIVIVPSAPQNVAAVPGNAVADVTWDEPAVEGGAAITKYQVAWNAAGSPAVTQDITLPAALSFQITGITNGTEYSVQVSAENSAGFGALSTAVQVTPATIADAPGDVAIVAGNPGELDVSWSAPAATGGAPITHYSLQWKAASVDVFAPADTADTADATTAYAIAELRGVTEYDVQIAAVNSAGTGEYSAITKATTGVATPDAPSTPAVSRADETGDGREIFVSWDAPADSGGAPIDSYQIRWRENTAQTFPDANIADTADAATTYTLGDLTNGTVYDVQIAAVNSAGVGDFSGSGVATPLSVPEAPNFGLFTLSTDTTSITFTAVFTTLEGSDSVSLDNGGSPVVDMHVRWKKADDADFTNEKTVAVATASSITGLEQGVRYEVQIAARNIVGLSVYTSREVETKTAVPGLVRNTKAVAGDREIIVTWDAPNTLTQKPITNYHIHWVDRALSGSALGDPEAIVDADARSFTITGLTNGVEYGVNVFAVNENGSSFSSEGGADSATPLSMPSAPQNVSASARHQALDIGWEIPADSGGASISGYMLRWKLVSAAVFDAGDAQSLGDVTAHYLTGLTNDAAYDVEVAAVNSAGAGEYAAAQGTPAKTPPLPPQNLTLTSANETLAVSWDAPVDDGGSAISHYTLRWKTAAAAEFDAGDTKDTADGSVTTDTITGLANGTLYEVEVAAENADNGAGDYARAQGTPSSVCSRTDEVAAAMVAAAKAASLIDAGDTCLNITGAHLAAITTLDVGSSSTSALKSGDFTGLTALTTLELDDNALTTLPADIFAGLETLQTLDLSGNALTTLPEGVFADLSALATLTLTGNSFASLPNGAFVGVPAAVQTALGLPDLPTDVAATRNDATSYDVAWQPPANAGSATVSGYTLRYKTPDASVFETPISVGAAARTHVITGLTSGADYEVQVAANRNYAFAGGSAITVGGNFADAVGLPGIPQNIVITPGNQILEVSWDAPAEGGADFVYDLRWHLAGNSTGPVGSEEPAYSFAADLSGTSFTIREAIDEKQAVAALRNFVPYEVEIRATNAAGESAYSTPLIARPVETRPDVPQNVTTSANDGIIHVIWESPASTGGAAITAYQVQWKEQSAAAFAPENAATTTGGARRYSISGLTNGTAYEARVAATNSRGTSDYSAGVTATPIGGVCGRTAQVRDVIVSELKNIGALANGEGCADVTGADLADSRFVLLYLGGESISALVFGDFAGMSALQTLDLGNNDLAALPADGFKDLTSLQTLNLHSNDLTALPANAFTGLSALQTLDLSDNDFASLAGNTFAKLSSLQDLDLGSSRKLTGVSSGVFAGLSSLQSLSLQFSDALTTLPADVFAGLSSLRTLNLSELRGLTALPPGVFADLSALQSLNLGEADALAAVLSPGVFDGLTAALQMELGVPGLPQNAVVIPGNIPTQLTVSWSPPEFGGGGGVAGYSLRWKPTSAADFAADDVQQVADTVNSTDISGLDSDFDYDVEIATASIYKLGGSGSPDIKVNGSYAAAAMLAELTAPGIPQNVAVIPKNLSLDVSWDAPASDGGVPVSAYIVRWKPAAEANFAAGDTATVSDATAHTITGLTNATEYEVQAAAIGRIGNGDFSASVNATPAPSVPALPADVAVTPADASMLVSWSAPGNDGGSAVTAYTLRWKSAAAAEFDAANTAEVAAPATTHTIENLANETAYEVQVAAANANGSGAFSAGAQVTPTPGICGRESTVQRVILGHLQNPDNNILAADQGCEYVTAAALADDALILLDLESEGIPALQAGDFAGLSSVEILFLAENSFTTLPEGVFTGLSSLRELDMSGNPQLASLPVGVLAGLSSLTNLSLSGGTLTTLPAGIFADLSALQSLQFGLHSFTELPPGVFTGLRRQVQTELGVPGEPVADAISPADGDSTLTINLKAPAFAGSGGVASYSLRWKQSDAAEYAEADVAVIAADQTTHTISVTTPSNVEAQIAAISNYAFAGRGSAIPVGGDYANVAMAPGVPQDLTAEASGNRALLLTWTAPAKSGVRPEYVMRWKLASETAFAAGDEQVVTALGATGASIKNLTAGVAYDVSIAARNRLGDSAFSPNAQATPVSVPDAPANVALTAGARQLDVSWDASPAATTGTPETTGYGVRWKLAAAADFAAGDIATVTAADTTYTITALQNGGAYEVQVAAINSVGTGDFSASVQATPRTTPNSPQNLAVLPGKATLDASWEAPDFNGGAAVTEYAIRWKPASAADFADGDAATTSADTTAYTITNLLNDTAYDVQVAASNEAGQGSFSDSAQATPINFDLNVDDSTGAESAPASDAILITRYLLGIRGAELIAGQTDTPANTVEENIESGRGNLDVDESGAADWKDGAMIARYIHGIRGADLVADKTSPPDNLTETSPETVVENILKLPVK